MLIVRPDAPLFYANAVSVRHANEAEVERRTSDDPVHSVVLDLDENVTPDITSDDQLLKLAQQLEAQKIRLGLAHVHGPVRDMAQRGGVMGAVGAEMVFSSIRAAVTWATTTNVEDS